MKIKSKILFLILLLTCTCLFLSACQRSTEIVGMWELIPHDESGETTPYSGYDFREDGTVTFYNGTNDRLPLSEGTWQIDPDDKNLLKICLTISDTPNQSIVFERVENVLYFYMGRQTHYDSAYGKTDHFSFDHLIAKARTQYEKFKADASMHCNLTPEEIIASLKQTGLTIGQVATFTDPHRPTGLLKEPNMNLAQAASFDDDALSETLAQSCQGMVEVYNDYTIQTANVLLRLDEYFPESNRTDCQTAFEEIVFANSTEVIQ
ncbi:hypothetical protein Q5O14_04545 [Eubacteriaceae bacterium ES2]|nr:hypothetical protein Q5O14_04545 [Eubacteriaceae bacterium ES2]